MRRFTTFVLVSLVALTLSATPLLANCCKTPDAKCCEKTCCKMPKAS